MLPASNVTVEESKDTLVRKKRSKRQSNVPFYLMLLPGLVVLIVNNYIPMFGVIMSFERYHFNDNYIKSLITSPFVGMDNFAPLFATSEMFVAIKNTILYNLAFIVLDVVLPVALAIALSEIWSKRKSKFYQSVAFLPYFLSWVIITYVAFSMLGYDYGLFNRILQAMGKDSIDWYSEPEYWPGFLILFHLWKYTGYNIVVYLASISGISDEYYEAAALDGATKWQQIRYITLPMLKTIVVIMTLLAVGRIFNSDFGLFFNVPRDSGALYAVTSTIDTRVYLMFRNTSDPSLSAAAGLFQAVAGCITVLIANAVTRKVDPDSALF